MVLTEVYVSHVLASVVRTMPTVFLAFENNLECSAHEFDKFNRANLHVSLLFDILLSSRDGTVDDGYDQKKDGVLDYQEVGDHEDKGSEFVEVVCESDDVFERDKYPGESLDLKWI